MQITASTRTNREKHPRTARQNIRPQLQLWTTLQADDSEVFPKYAAPLNRVLAFDMDRLDVQPVRDGNST